MKKLVSIGVAVVLLVSAVAFIAGCSSSGDTAKAKQYMKAGDALVKQTETQGNQLPTATQKALSSATDPASLKTSMELAKKETAKVNSTANKAKAVFQKIKALNGVAEYKKYADLEIESMDLVVQLDTELDKLMDQVVTIASSPSGTTEQLTAAQQAFAKKSTDISSQITKLQTEADNLKKQKNL